MEDIEFEIHVIINGHHSGSYKISVDCFNKLKGLFDEKGTLKQIYEEKFSFIPNNPDFDFEKDIQC